MPPTDTALDPDELRDEVLGDAEGSQSNGDGNAYVCDVVTDDGVCGETFSEARFLGTHKASKHGIRGRSRSASYRHGDKDKPPKKPGRQRKPPVEKATKAAMPPPTDRAAIYTASLSMAAMAAYLALPPFDATDLDICNSGMPNVGRALAQLAETNPSVARTCDLILAGGGGGWVALLMAIVPIAGGIAAHHGALPASSGARFGEMIGMAPVPSAAPSAGAPSPPPEASEPIDVVAFFSGTPDTVMTDATEKMMAMGGPIAVRVPMTPMENPDGHRGSEQLRPVEAEPAAEPEPAARVS